jgi:hypothetical protein
MDVILSDSGTANGSIHNATGVPTGIWQPDSASTLDGTFGGMTADGTWTLYLADEATGGGTSTLLDWGLQVDANPVPDSSCHGLDLVGGLVLLVLLAGRRRSFIQVSQTA